MRSRYILPVVPWQTALLSLLLFACGASTARHIAEPRHIAENSGAPEVKRVVDLGDMSSIPARGALPTDRSDGVFVIGELVLVEGNDFGKLPTIAIGGKPAKSLARTQSGGILVRIPQEIDAGKTRVVVSHPDGKHGIDIEVRRYLALGDKTSIRMVSAMSDGSLHEQEPLPISSIVDLEFGHDGQALYALGTNALSVIALAAQGGPSMRARMPVKGKSPHRLVSRIGVPVLALLQPDAVTLFDTRVPTAISVSGRVVVPGGVRAAAFSPEGGYLAVLSSQGNALSLIALGDDTSIVAKLDLMWGDTVPLVQDLVFSPAGDEIWVLSGNNTESVVAGIRPTRISIVKRESGTLRFLRAATIGLAPAPRFMAVSQRESVMAAAAVRSTSQRAAMVLSSVSAELMADTANSEKIQGQLLRFDLDGNASVLAEGSSIFSEIRLSHEQSRVYAATRTLGEGRRSLGLTSIALDGGKTSYLRLADDTESNLLTPLPLAIAP